MDRQSDDPALIVADRPISYRRLSERVGRWRVGLTGAGVGPGDRVAIVAAEDAFVVAHLAVLGIGAISVPLNPRSPPAELARELDAVEAIAAIVDTDRRTMVAAAPTDRTLLLLTDVELDAAGIDADEPRPIVEVERSTPAVLLFTSGTGGPPRPAILTHGNLTASLEAVLSLPIPLVGHRHVFLAVIPLFHVFGLSTVLHLALVIGGAVVLGDLGRPAAAVDAIERHRVTVVAGPPTLWRALSQVPDVGPEHFSTVALAVSGAARLPAGVALDVRDRLGIELSDGYGLTESSAVVASSIATDAPLGSVGRLLPGVEARIVDEEDRDCLIGDPGELLVRGPMVFPGYWGSDHTDQLSADGWLRTGDIAVVDEQGHLAIVDRRKDLIIVSGFNVFPAEVEAVLTAHPDVAEAGIVGEPVEATGEAVVAFVVPEPGSSIDEAELRRHCDAELARYKVPARFVLVTELPVGPSGKLQRGRLS